MASFEQWPMDVGRTTDERDERAGSGCSAVGARTILALAISDSQLLSVVAGRKQIQFERLRASAGCNLRAEPSESLQHYYYYYY